MGHLSTSDRVNTTVVAPSHNGVSEKDTTQTLPLCNGINNANGICGAKLSNGTVSSSSKVHMSTSSSILLNGSWQNGGSNTVVLQKSEVKVLKNDAVDNDNVEVKVQNDWEPTYHTDLEQYTKSFKGDNVFGIQFKAPLKWDKVFQIFLLHCFFVYGFFITSLREVKFATTLLGFFTGGLAGFGVTGGAHRLWTHRSFKANVPLRTILMGCFSLAGQNTLYDWVRDHRVHHKYSETDGDPHNSNRGFFFAHVGWLMMHKHPEVMKRGRQMDLSDVINDPVVQFHQKYFIPLKILLCFVIPTFIPIYFWDETFTNAFVSQCIFRYVLSLHFTWSVNSAAHLWGSRPYDKRIMPSENLFVAICAMGEGWHNYHHVFPWDYKAAEFGKYSVNLTTLYLDIFHKIGWAWDMKQPSKELVKRTLTKYGDGSHFSMGHAHLPEVPCPTEEDVCYDENKNFKKD